MLKGSIVALITPMNGQGNICKLSLKKLIDYHIASGTSAIISVGTTGEFATLSQREHINVVMTTLEIADNRIPVVAGIGANATDKAIRLVQRFSNSGVAGCLTVTPYYNLPTQDGLFQHFKAIAEHTDLPHILYNVPCRTGCDLFPETVGRLASIKNIVGIKEATGDLSRVYRLRELSSKDFILLSGNDVTALDFMQLGGDGVISVTANIAAQDMAEICKLSAVGHYQQARALNQRLMPLHRELFVEPNPIPVKWACKKLGLIATDALRLPMTPITDYSREIITLAMKRAGLL